MFVIMPVPPYLDYVALQQGWKSETSRQDCLVILGHLKFCPGFNFGFPISSKTPVEILMEITLNPQITLQSLAMSTVLSLPIHKHAMSSFKILWFFFSTTLFFILQGSHSSS